MFFDRLFCFVLFFFLYIEKLKIQLEKRSHKTTEGRNLDMAGQGSKNSCRLDGMG